LRQRFKKGTLSTDHIRRLEELGFEWEPSDAAWEERFGQLVGYKKVNKHCNVLDGWPDNPILARWVGTQRTRYKKEKLSPDRVRRLEEIGFEWKLKK